MNKLENIKLEMIPMSFTKEDFNKGNKIQLSMTVDSTAEYETNAQDYFRKAMIGENSTRSRFGKQILGVKDRVKLGTVLFDSLIKAGDCDFDPTGSKVSQKEFVVEPLMAGTSVCIKQLEIAFMSDQLLKGSRNFTDKIAFMDFFYATLAKSLQEEMEILTMQGDKSGATGTYLDTVDGLEKQLSNDANVLTPADTAVAIDKNNVIDALIEARDTLPKAVVNKADFVYIVSPNVYFAYLDAISENKASGQYYSDDMKPNFQGKEIFKSDGASNNIIIATYWDNLANIQDLITDETGFEIVDFYKTRLDRKIGVRTDFKFVPGYINSEEVYFYEV